MHQHPHVKARLGLGATLQVTIGGGVDVVSTWHPLRRPVSGVDVAPSSTPRVCRRGTLFDSPSTAFCKRKTARQITAVTGDFSSPTQSL